MALQSPRRAVLTGSFQGVPETECVSVCVCVVVFVWAAFGHFRRDLHTVAGGISKMPGAVGVFVKERVSQSTASRQNSYTCSLFVWNKW